MTQTENSRLIRNADYSAFMKDVKRRIQTAQIKAAVRVNQELLGLYWDLGEQIIEKQRDAQWGDGFLEQMSRDLLDEFPEMKGFSFRNLKHVRQWVEFWIPIGKQLVSQLTKQPASQLDSVEFVRQLVAQIPWGHNILIFQKIKNHDEALFYVRKTIENNWSRAVLTHQIESGLYQRDGKAITNFEATLPAPQSDLAIQTLKDPYNFDFLMLRERHDEQKRRTGFQPVHAQKRISTKAQRCRFCERVFERETGRSAERTADGCGRSERIQGVVLNLF